jgi:hypothetical protein
MGGKLASLIATNPDITTTYPNPNAFSMTRVFSLAVFLVSFLGLIAHGQTFSVPENLKLETREDLIASKDFFLQAVNFIEKTPIDLENKDRFSADFYVMSWVMRSPLVSVVLSEYTQKLHKKNKELLTAYIGGWARNELLHPQQTKDQHAVAAIRCAVAVYSLGGKAKKDSVLETLKALKTDAEIAAWIQANS